MMSSERSTRPMPLDCIEMAKSFSIREKYSFFELNVGSTQVDNVLCVYEFSLLLVKRSCRLSGKKLANNISCCAVM